MRSYAGIAALAALFIATLFVDKLFVTPKSGPALDHFAKENALSVGLVFDIGGIGDKSYNDSAYRGIKRAEAELGIKATTIEPGDGADRAAALRMLAASGHKLIFGVGFIFTDDILQVAADYPDVSFAGLDFALRYDEKGQPLPLPKNVLALKFREEEGAFLVGVLAANVSTTKKLGFVGGMDIPLIHKFASGYRAGVKAVCPDCSLSILYAGVTPNAFKDPGKGREMALSQYESGADIVFHAAGATGLGVFQAARETGKLAVGVDSDQSAEAPGFILTSLVKRIDQAVLTTISEAAAGHFVSGVRWLGLKEDGVELAENDDNRHYFTVERQQLLAHFVSAIEAGQVHVPDHD